MMFDDWLFKIHTRKKEKRIRNTAQGTFGLRTTLQSYELLIKECIFFYSSCLQCMQLVFISCMKIDYVVVRKGQSR